MVTLPIAGGDGTYEVRPSKIIALGLNYREHIAESASVAVRGFDDSVPTEPVIFAKTPNALCGPGDAILLPAIIADYGFENARTDYEAELAFVIGRRGKNIAEGQAWDYVAGYTCANDVSQRNTQNGDRSGWFRGKSFDTFLPIGPLFVPAGDLKDPHNLAIQARLNGSVVQDSNTRHMIFTIPEIVRFLSRNFTLEAGDFILTGTPSGVGPMEPGDTIEIEIEGIGTLKNPVQGE